MTESKKLEVVLDAIEEFEDEWYEKHPEGKYTEEHYEEFREAKKQYIEDYLREYERDLAEYEAERLEDYYNDGEHQYGWYQQDMIDRYRMER